jgi:hypothetical protein
MGLSVVAASEIRADLLLLLLLTASVIYWSEFLATDPEFRVRFPALPDFLRSSGSGTGSTHPREDNLGAT